MLEGQLGGGTRDWLSRTQARRCVLHAHLLSARVGQTLPVGHSGPAARSCTAGELGMVFKI